MNNEPCPKDTDGDGNCGNQYCPFCGKNIKPVELPPAYKFDGTYPTQEGLRAGIIPEGSGA